MAQAQPLHPDLAREAAPLNDKEKACEAAIKKAIGDEAFAKQTRSFITRFIRGFATEKDPIQASIDHIKEAIKFREEIKAEELRDAELPKTEIFRKLWPAGFHGLCKQGRPIYVERVGMIDPDGLEKNFTFDDLTKFHVQLIERLQHRKDQLSEKYGRMMYKHIVVIDLAGFGTKHFSSKCTGPVKSFAHIDQLAYSESLYRMIICNAPFVFKVAWKLVRPWLHPLTRERILMGSDYLKEYIDESQIPHFLKGKCKCAAQRCLEVPFDDGMQPVLDKKAPQPASSPKDETKTQAAVEENIDLNSVSECVDEEAQGRALEDAIDKMRIEEQKDQPVPKK